MELNYEKITELIAAERKKSSEKWCDENIGLFGAAIDKIKNDLKSKLENEYQEMKKDILNKVTQQLNDVLKTSAREIDEYMETLSLEKQKEYFLIIQNVQKGKQPIPIPKIEIKSEPKNSFTQMPAFEEDITAIFNSLSAAGEDTSKMTIMADDCMYHRGEIYFKGSNIFIKSKSGKMFPVLLESITKTEIDVLFKDNTSITVSEEDLKTGKVVISLSQ